MKLAFHSSSVVFSSNQGRINHPVDLGTKISCGLFVFLTSSVYILLIH